MFAFYLRYLSRRWEGTPVTFVRETDTLFGHRDVGR